MSRPATDDHLLTYEKYFDLKERFSKEYDKNDGLDLEQFLNNTDFNIKNGLLIRLVFKKLSELIRNRGIFMSNQDKACNYISYLFSKEIQSKVDEYEPKTFEMFQNFVNKYNTRTKLSSNICHNSLVYVNSDMYAKMNTLYTLYELHKGHRGKNLLGDPKNCPAFNFFLLQYNEFIRNNQPTNDHYKYILDLFEKEIQRDEYTYRRFTCEKERFHIEKIELRTLPKEKSPKASIQEEQQSNHSEYQVFPAKSPPTEAELQAPREEPGTVHAKPQATHLESQTAQEHPQTLHEVNQSAQETSALGAHHTVQEQPQQRLAREETHQRILHVNSSPVYTPLNGALETLGTASYSERYPYSSVQSLSNEVEGDSSVMNTITSALKGVDPVPVVGVSGGMGALFLLFRLEPSLEEADVDNESLLDSMEDTQDFSQVFKHLKRGIFHMIKLI
ncbi:hypothetical protein PVC01_000121000 [Plasmodium vivax]|uniref:VIR protein n=1 Tax=Plasmodium vivax TaxID=5855 RepID=A0A1G4E4N7_PLAVI|nr:hypothetical protein PVC01_000121000 [Plasmodium vivax]